MIIKPVTQLVEYKPLRSEPSYRVLLDLGEINGDMVTELHYARTTNDCGAIIGTSNEIEAIQLLLQQPTIQESLNELIKSNYS